MNNIPITDYNSFMIELGIIYKQPAYFESEHGQIINRAYAVVWEWTENNIPQSGLQKFYRMIVEQFEPSSTVPFPLPAHLSKIWISQPQELNYYKPERIEFNQSEFEKINEIPALSESEKSKISWENILHDQQKLNTAQLLKKYGVIKCGEFWQMVGAWCHDNNHDTKQQSLENLHLSEKDLIKYEGVRGII